MSLFDAVPSPAPGLSLTAPGPASVLLRAKPATELVQTREALEALRADWEALETHALGATLFQGAAWARAVFAYEEKRGNTGFFPVVVALRHEGELMGVLALERVGTGLHSALVPLGNSFAQYAELLIDPALDPIQALAPMLRAAIETARPDLVQFLKVRKDGALWRGMPKTAVRTGEPDGAPFVVLEGHADFASVLQTVRLKTRKNMRNARNRLEREGRVEHLVAETPEEKLGVIRRTLQGRAERLREQGLTSRAFRTGDFAGFCASLAECEGGPELLAMSLRHKGEPIAEQWGFVHQGRYYAYVTARDFAQSEESPGKLHLREVLETCFDRGIKVADLLAPTMPYKLTWASGVVEIADFALPVSLKGSAAIHLWDRALRPLAKRAVLSLPLPLRAKVMAFLKRG